MKSMYAQYYEEPKYRPSFLSEPRVRGGAARPQDAARLVHVRSDGVARRSPSRRYDRHAEIRLGGPRAPRSDFRHRRQGL